MELVGIIKVPLLAFTHPKVGRGYDPAIIRRLSRVFQRTGCAPEEVQNHVEGMIDSKTLTEILSQLNLSLAELASTASSHSYPEVRLRDCIVCLDGNQRIAAARQQSGPEYWWTVQLYFAKGGVDRAIITDRSLRHSHQTRNSDGDIFFHARRAELANRLQSTQVLRVQLSPCKEKILNRLLKRQAPEGLKVSIVDALDSLTRYPGLRNGLWIANWHRHFAIQWDEPIIHCLHTRMRPTYQKNFQGVKNAEQYLDITTVRRLALRCPQYTVDATFIREKMKDCEIFSGLKDASSRQKILENILSLKVIIPSLESFHKNMKYFAVGAKILRQHILAEDGPEGASQSVAQRLKWSPPSSARIEASEADFTEPVRLDFRTALKALFVTALRLFPYLSDDRDARPYKDVRGEVAMQPVIDAGCVYHLRKVAQHLGFWSPKIEKGLVGKQPSRCKPFNGTGTGTGTVLDSKWKCGKPGLRAFLHLQECAFLPRLDLIDGSNGTVPLFVLRDFLDSFFGPDLEYSAPADDMSVTEDTEDNAATNKNTIAKESDTGYYQYGNNAHSTTEGSSNIPKRRVLGVQQTKRKDPAFAGKRKRESIEEGNVSSVKRPKVDVTTKRKRESIEEGNVSSVKRPKVDVTTKRKRKPVKGKLWTMFRGVQHRKVKVGPSNKAKQAQEVQPMSQLDMQTASMFPFSSGDEISEDDIPRSASKASSAAATRNLKDNSTTPHHQQDEMEPTSGGPGPDTETGVSADTKRGPSSASRRRSSVLAPSSPISPDIEIPSSASPTPKAPSDWGRTIRSPVSSPVSPQSEL